MLLLIQAILQLFTLYRYHLLHPGGRAPHNIVCDVLSQVHADYRSSLATEDENESSVPSETPPVTSPPLYPACAASSSFSSSSCSPDQYPPLAPLAQQSAANQQRIQRLLVEGCTFGLRSLRALQSLFEIYFFRFQGGKELYATKRFSVCLWIEVIKVVLKMYIHSSSRLRIYADDETICRVFESIGLTSEEPLADNHRIQGSRQGPPQPHFRAPFSRYSAVSVARRTRRHVSNLRSAKTLEEAELQRADDRPHTEEHEIFLRAGTAEQRAEKMEAMGERLEYIRMQDTGHLGTEGHRDFLTDKNMEGRAPSKLPDPVKDENALNRKTMHTPVFPLFLATLLRVAFTAARLGVRAVVNEWSKRARAANRRDDGDEEREQKQVFTKSSVAQQPRLTKPRRDPMEDYGTAQGEKEKRRDRDSLNKQSSFLRLLAVQKKHLLIGEFLYHFRPIFHLLLLRRAFRKRERRRKGTPAVSLHEGLWLPWAAAVAIDILSNHLIQKGLVQEWEPDESGQGAAALRQHVDAGFPLPTAEEFEQAELQSRRKCIYLAALRSPFFDKFLLRPSEGLEKLLKSIPFLRNFNILEAFLVYRHLYFTTSGT
uniref:Peroxisomal membrane protein PEX16 n=1 Tax=Neospora caninum (strain Liverpool) TaxID=572307 RepID=A0A0F7U9G7_NEOCL|nr:TPA: hypothetical protein BN1204_011305 [Neospora caninum Liverpool]